MNAAVRRLGAAALGAAAMYWLDPASGRRRRARLRDQLASKAGDLREVFDAGGRDLVHRLEGMLTRARTAYEGRTVSDATVEERARAALGRAVSHPGAIKIEVSKGRAVLSGTVLAHEFPRLMRTVRAVRGIEAVDDRLAVHAEGRGISALQGGRSRRPPRSMLLREQWPPAARLVAGAAGTVLTASGLYTRGFFGALGVIAGGSLLARSATNMPLRRWVDGAGHRGTGVHIHRTIRMKAPVDQVFKLLCAYENYPLFMRNVLNVRRHPDGRSHWWVAGPAGVTLEWDSITTQLEHNRLLAWRTVTRAPLQHAGVIRLEPANGGTRLDVLMSYQPPAGALGHLLASLFGADPKNALDQDLLRLKSFLETGRTPRDAAVHSLQPHGFRRSAIPTVPSAESGNGAGPLH